MIEAALSNSPDRPDVTQPDDSISRRTVLTASLAAVIGALVGTGGRWPVLGKADSAVNELLAMTPDPAAFAADPFPILYSAANPALQLQTLGLSDLDSVESPDFKTWIAANFSLAFPEVIANKAILPEFVDFLGWNMAQVDQAVESLHLPEGLMLVRGRFDRQAVADAWDRNGYQRVEVGGLEVAQLSADAGFDLSSEISRFALGKINNAAWLDERTLVYATSQAVMEAVAATVDGSVESVFVRGNVEALSSALPTELVTSMLVDGSVLSSGEETGPGRGHQPVSSIVHALLGHTAGLPLQGAAANNISLTIDAPDSVVLMAVEYLNQADAEAGLARAFEQLGNGETPSDGRPFAELFSSWSGSVVSDSPIIVLELTPSRNPAVWQQLLFRGDLTFLS